MRPCGHVDAPETTTRRKKIILSKRFLYNFYRECYSFFLSATKDVPKGPRLEIGSGAGFLQKHIAGVLRSDVLFLRDLDLICAAQSLPFGENVLSAIYMLNVLHHVQNVEVFFNEVKRCLKPGATLVMIEPAANFWSGLIYKNFHNERFDRRQRDWKLPVGGPLSTANSALPWIIFERDRNLFTRKYPELIIEKIDYVFPFRYLLSGGYSYRQLLPGISYPIVTFIEKMLRPFNQIIGLFMCVKILCAKQKS